MLADVLFDYDEFTLRSSSIKILNLLVRYLRDNPEDKVDLMGHTDNVGSESYNLKLSQQRASACKLYVIEQGIDKSRVMAIGLGEIKPIVGNSNAKDRQLNRRTEIKVQ